MEIIKKIYVTPKGNVEGVQVKSEVFSILLVGGKKGTLVCGVFDLGIMQGFNMPAAIVESSPANPIGTLERFPLRKIAKVNDKARALGIEPGMDVTAAFEIIA